MPPPCRATNNLPGDRLARVIVKAARHVGRCSVQNRQKVSRSNFGRNRRMATCIVTRELCRDRSGMERDEHRLFVCALQFDRGTADELVQSGFGRAIGMPAPDPIVSDGPHPSREHADHGFLILGKPSGQMFQDQGRADRIDGECFGHHLGFDRGK